MSAAAAMRLTQLHSEPRSTLVGPAHAPATARRCRYSHGLIRRLITVTDREGVVLSSGACIGMPPAVGCPVTYLNDMGGSSRAALVAALRSQPLELPLLRDFLRIHLSDRAYPQMVLRLGTTSQTAVSVRRPVEEVLL
jgi:hypothetical protein